MYKQALFQSIHSYIYTDMNRKDEVVINYDSMEGMGEHFFHDILTNVSDADNDSIKFVISYIFRKKKPLNTFKDYYLALCEIAGYKRLPNKTYRILLREYVRIFRREYRHVLKLCTDKICDVDYKYSAYEHRQSVIENSCDSEKLYIKDLQPYENALIENARKCNVLRTEKQMLIFIRNFFTNTMNSYCDINDNNAVISKVKQEALKACTINFEEDIKEAFSYYESILEATEINIKEVFKIIYTLRKYPMYQEITEEYRREAFAYKLESKEEKQLLNKYKNAISSLPDSDFLKRQKENDLPAYKISLESFVSDYDVVEKLEEKIKKCICLKFIEEQLLLSIQMFRDKEYGAFGSTMPIQIEGMFNHYLNDATLFERFSRMKIYISPDLQQKITYIESSNNKILFEAILYFKFYFNNLIRNPIAHGRYNLIYDIEEKKQVFAY